MKQEFIECYDKVIYDAENGLQKALLIKLKSMELCQEQLDNFRFERDFKSNYETQHYQICCHSLIDVQRYTLSHLNTIIR